MVAIHPLQDHPVGWTLPDLHELWEALSQFQDDSSWSSSFLRRRDDRSSSRQDENQQGQRRQQSKTTTTAVKVQNKAAQTTTTTAAATTAASSSNDNSNNDNKDTTTSTQKDTKTTTTSTTPAAKATAAADSGTTKSKTSDAPTTTASPSSSSSSSSSASGSWVPAYVATGGETVSAFQNSDGKVLSVAYVDSDGHTTTVPYTNSAGYSGFPVAAATSTTLGLLTAAGTATPNPDATSVTSTSTSNNGSSGSTNSSSTRAGVVAGIVIGLVILSLLIFCFFRYRRAGKLPGCLGGRPGGKGNASRNRLGSDDSLVREKVRAAGGGDGAKVGADAEAGMSAVGASTDAAPAHGRKDKETRNLLERPAMVMAAVSTAAVSSATSAAASIAKSIRSVAFYRSGSHPDRQDRQDCQETSTTTPRGASSSTSPSVPSPPPLAFDSSAPSVITQETASIESFSTLPTVQSGIQGRAKFHASPLPLQARRSVVPQLVQISTPKPVSVRSHRVHSGSLQRLSLHKISRDTNSRHSRHASHPDRNEESIHETNNDGTVSIAARRKKRVASINSISGISIGGISIASSAAASPATLPWPMPPTSASENGRLGSRAGSQAGDAPVHPVHQAHQINQINQFNQFNGYYAAGRSESVPELVVPPSISSGPGSGRRPSLPNHTHLSMMANYSSSSSPIIPSTLTMPNLPQTEVSPTASSTTALSPARSSPTVVSPTALSPPNGPSAHSTPRKGFTTPTVITTTALKNPAPASSPSVRSPTRATLDGPGSRSLLQRSHSNRRRPRLNMEPTPPPSQALPAPPSGAQLRQHGSSGSGFYENGAPAKTVRVPISRFHAS